MINRYIYAVTQKLPQAQREDIAEELRGLIEDMLEARVQGRKVTDKDVEAVLVALGNPKHLAQKYRGTKKYLIGPELFDAYILVLKIVLISIAVSMGVGFVIQIILNPISILDHFIDFIVSFVTVIPMAFGWTTFGFAIGEYSKGIHSKDLQMDKEWKVSDLAPIPDKKRQIKRGESITGIIFYVLFIVIFAFSSEYFGIWVFHEEFSGVVPFLNEETYGSYLFFIILIFGFGIIKECLKLIFGKWTMKLVIYTSIVNLVSMIAILFMVNGPAFWNPDFMLELTQAGFLTEGSEAFRTVSGVWEQSTSWILILLVFGLIWDAADGFLKVRKK
ncbi:HAAS signaling domain-containing protein [Pueribacillus theae]